MGNSFQRLWYLFKSPTNSRTLSVLALLIIVAAVPLTVIISQKQQELRQNAAGTRNLDQGTACSAGSSYDNVYDATITNYQHAPNGTQWVVLNCNSCGSNSDCPKNTTPYNGSTSCINKDTSAWCWGGFSGGRASCLQLQPIDPPNFCKAGAQPPGCDPNQINMSYRPVPGINGQTITFNVHNNPGGNQGSGWISDTWSGGVNCGGTTHIWNDQNCTATTIGSFTWAHTWHTCYPGSDEQIQANCPQECHLDLPYTISAATSALNSQFISQSCPPPNMTAGQSANVSVVMKNTGTTTWTQADLIRLGSQNPTDNTFWGTGRVDLGTNTVAPNANYTFNFQAVAPTTAGTYNFQWKMLQEGNAWFGDTTTPNCSVIVAAQNSTDIILKASFHLQSVGINPNIRENHTPKHTTRSITIQVFDQSNNKVLEKADQQIIYNSSTGNFDGTFNLGQISPGSYLVKGQTPKYLRKLIARIFTVTAGTTQYTIPDLQTLIVGDINTDNKIDPLDYNAYVGCFGNKANNTTTCPSKDAVDLNDDGLTDTITDNTDFAWLFNSFENQEGD